MVDITKCEENIYDYINDSNKKCEIDSIDDIIDYVIFGKNNLLREDSTALKFESGNIKKRKDVELRDVITDFINDHFLGSKKILYSYTKMLLDGFNNILKKYIEKIQPIINKKYGLNIDLSKKIIVIFKGGNTLKSIKERYTYMQNGYISRLIDDYYFAYFKNSDLDFQIVIHKYITETEANMEIYEIIKDQLANIYILYLNRLRNYMLGNLNNIFTFFKYNKKTKREILKEVLEKLNNCEIIKNKSHEFKENFIEEFGEQYKFFTEMKFNNIVCGGVSIDEKLTSDYVNNYKKNNTQFVPVRENLNIFESQFPESSKYDFFVKSIGVNNFINKLNCNILSNDINFVSDVIKDKTEFVIQYADKVVITNMIDDTPFINDFSLIRMKYNLLATFETTDNKLGAINIAGELIDLSINCYNDYKLKKFTSAEDEITKFYSEYKFNNNEYDISFNYWSYNINSFIYDLHSMLFYEIDIPWNNKKYKKRIYRILFMCLIEIFALPKLDCDKILDFLIHYADQEIEFIYRADYFDGTIVYDEEYKELGIFNILKEHKRIYNYAILNEAYSKFNEYYSFIFENIKIYRLIYGAINKYCNQDIGGKIPLSEMLTITQFAGNKYKQKYMKYKYKYLQIKKFKNKN